MSYYTQAYASAINIYSFLIGALRDGRTPQLPLPKGISIKLNIFRVNCVNKIQGVDVKLPSEGYYRWGLGWRTEVGSTLSASVKSRIQNLPNKVSNNAFTAPGRLPCPSQHDVFIHRLRGRKQAQSLLCRLVNVQVCLRAQQAACAAVCCQ